ncbi:MAG: DNA gyrase subunit A [Coriobacteriia bacterium]|nr:DNA gyrase subunit A [Coriobacteriia bacterium]
MEENNTNIKTAHLDKEMQTSFLEYSMSVIVARALPDVKDGLKPVHRRILYAMEDAGFTPNKPHMKSARTVGDVIGKYHPHGDVAVYDTMVRMAQPFSMRVPLVDGHGNFGSIDGDSPAAMRYTEARLDKRAMEMLRDLDKDTVDFVPNYDESLEEPVVLPARFPNLLVNGSNGIAVGMATNIPPHNLGETIDAVSLLLDNPDASIQDIMQVMPGPDFPTGGQLMGKKGILDYFETGRGSLTIRAKCDVVEKKNGRNQIIVKEIPYQVNRQRLLEKLGELVRDKKLPEISNIHDGADRHGIDIIIELKNNAVPEVVLNKLYKQTQMQISFGVIMLALVDGVPKILPLKDMLGHYIDHQKDVITRRTKFELDKAEKREHILEGYVIALDHIDEVIKIIRGSQTDKEAADKLTEKFGLSKAQTDAILEMKLRRLTGLERDKIEEELAALRERIAYLKAVLEDEALVRKIIKEEMEEIKDKFGTERMTELCADAKEINIEDLIAEEDMVITLTHSGYIKRMKISAYRNQKRGGKGMSAGNLKEDDFIEDLFIASTHAYMLFFSNRGKVYRKKVYEIPESSRTARGSAIVNLLNLAPGEKIAAIIAVKDYAEDECLMFATETGMVKKTELKAYDTNRANGLIAINLKPNDHLIDVQRVRKDDRVIMVSSEGKSIMWDEQQVRPTGRGTMGVKGMNIPDEVQVLGMNVAKEGTELLVVTENGYGKRTQIEEYPLQNRGGKGVFTIKMTKKKGLLSVMKVVGLEDEVMLITQNGILVRTAINGISRLGRATQGVRIMNVSEGDKVVAISKLTNEKEEEEIDAQVEELAGDK